MSDACESYTPDSRVGVLLSSLYCAHILSILVGMSNPFTWTWQSRRNAHLAPLRVNSRDFLLGFAVLQAIPGPLFNFSVFLGVLTLPSQPVLGAFLGCVAIFLPGIVLKVGLLPLYTRWRSSKTTRSVLRGLNAAAVGLVCNLCRCGRSC